jgi:simple sugar transport system permease protein
MTTNVKKSSAFSRVSEKIRVPVISIIISLILSIFLLLLMEQDPILAMQSISLDIIFNQKGEIELNTLANVFFYSTPLLLTGLSVAVAFRAGMFNIGTEGQVIIGGFSAALIGSALASAGYNLPFFLMIPVLIVSGLIGGALWALVPALLKTRGVHEVITTIMMNYIANTLMVFLIGDLNSPFSDKSLGGNVSPQTPPIASTGRIPTIFGRGFSPLHWGFVINILVCVIIFIILWRTQLGYETRAVGHNTSAAKYGGISVNKNLVKVMLISGALGGLAGGLIVMGPLYGFFLYGSTVMLGFDGIAVALIGGNHPFGVIFGAILFGWLQASTTKLQQNNIPKDIANTMKGFIVLIVAIPLFSKMIIDKLIEYKSNASVNFTAEEYHNPIILFGLYTIYIFSGILGDILILLFKWWTLIKNKINFIITVLIILSSILYISISGQFVPGFFGGNFVLELPFITLISCILAVSFIGSYFLIKKKYPETKPTRLFPVFILIFVAISFLNLVSLFGQEIILFLSLVLVTFFILYQESRARDSGLPKREIEEIGFLTESNYDKNKVIKLYTIATILVLILTFLVMTTETIGLPIQIWLFFVTLEDFSATFGLIGILMVIIMLVVLRQISVPKNKSTIYYLPIIFGVLTVLFGFVSVSSIFKMNPYLLFTQTLSIATPIGFASIGGMFSEKSGVVNIGLEGMMLSGAFVAVWVTYVTHDPWMGVFGAVLSGVLMGLLHAVASIKFRANQVVVGVAINILASALSMLGLVFVWGVRGTSPGVTGLQNIKMPFLQEIPVIGELLYSISGSSAGISPLVYLFLFFILISYWIIERTSFGLRIRAVGEHPRAADTLGIDVFKMRYIAVALSGILAALGGAQLTLGWSPIFGRDMTTGRGFVALAALIFGGWSPIGAGLASLLFGFAIAFRRQLEALGIKWALSLFGFVWRLEKLTPMLPYITTIVAVATVAKRMRPPTADGIPYEKEGG